MDYLTIYGTGIEDCDVKKCPFDSVFDMPSENLYSDSGNITSVPSVSSVSSTYGSPFLDSQYSESVYSPVPDDKSLSEHRRERCSSLDIFDFGSDSCDDQASTASSNVFSTIPLETSSVASNSSVVSSGSCEFFPVSSYGTTLVSSEVSSSAFRNNLMCSHDLYPIVVQTPRCHSANRAPQVIYSSYRINQVDNNGDKFMSHSQPTNSFSLFIPASASSCVPTQFPSSGCLSCKQRRFRRMQIIKKKRELGLISTANCRAIRYQLKQTSAKRRIRENSMFSTYNSFFCVLLNILKPLLVF